MKQTFFSIAGFGMIAGKTCRETKDIIRGQRNPIYEEFRNTPNGLTTIS
jgi:hypothetical protein